MSGHSNILMLPFIALIAFAAAGCLIAARARLRGRVTRTELSMSEDWLAEQSAAREWSSR